MTLAIALGTGGIWLALAIFTRIVEARRLERYVAQRPLLNRYWDGRQTLDHLDAASPTRGTGLGLENAHTHLAAETGWSAP
jgi:hypothetical protein